MGTDFGEKKNSNWCIDTADFTSTPPYLWSRLQAITCNWCVPIQSHALGCKKKNPKCQKIRKIPIPVWSWCAWTVLLTTRNSFVVIHFYSDTHVLRLLLVLWLFHCKRDCPFYIIKMKKEKKSICYVLIFRVFLRLDNYKSPIQNEIKFRHLWHNWVSIERQIKLPISLKYHLACGVKLYHFFLKCSALFLFVSCFVLFFAPVYHCKRITCRNCMNTISYISIFKPLL